MKSRYCFLFLTLLTAFSVIAAEKTQSFPVARLTIVAVDEQSAPIQGARVNLVFTETNSYRASPVSGLTDSTGRFSGQGGSDSRLGGSVRKDGYYIGGFPFEPFREEKDGHWQPWDATYTSVLRKIENPVAMYAKRAWIQIPEIGKPCGYDLEAGDWVSPHGGGKVPDFVFTLRRAYTNSDQFEVCADLTFSNPLDGIQETELPKGFAQSWFKWPRQAPESGYKRTWRSELGAPNKMHSIEDVEKQKFFFRVRTVEQDGKIVHALYGKLSEGFQLAPYDSNTCKVRLSYYLNPTALDRNLEFDLKKNLLKNLNDLEAPRDP